MAEKTSYAMDIRPLFTDRDVHAMSKAFNLASYNDVKAHAAPALLVSRRALLWISVEFPS